MRCTSACALARVNTERGLSCTSLVSVALSTSRLPSKATWLMTGFSTTVMTTSGAFAVDAHVGEQAGREQRPDRLVDLAGIVGVADVEAQIGANRLGLDAAVADDPDVADGAALRLRRDALSTPPAARRSARKTPPRGDDEVPAPRLARSTVLAFFPSAFRSPIIPSRTLPVGVGWALTQCSSRAVEPGTISPRLQADRAEATFRGTTCLTVQCSALEVAILPQTPSKKPGCHNVI